MELKFTVHTKIQKPVAEVFDAVRNPDHLSRYFTTGGASAPLSEGTKVIWRFADYPGDVEVEVRKVVPNELIVFEWAAGEGADYNTRTEMKFEQVDPESTLVSITEGTWKETQEDLAKSYGNCQGWSQMSSALKAYLEYGINLRKGAY